jgi:hypothetical protein
MLVHELTKKSNDNINFVMETYPHLLHYSFSDTYFMKLIYTLLCKAQETRSKTKIEHESNVTPVVESSRFVPSDIKIHIENTKYERYTITIYVRGACFEILLYTPESTDIQRFVSFIKLVIVLCSKDVELQKKYNITMILTDFEKGCDDSITCIEPIHINSAYNYKTQIVVFRREELLKVFIHECFHLFCLDFKDVDIDFKPLLQPLFHVNSDYLLFEPLCEFWARTLNAAILSFFVNKDTSYEEFERYYNLNLNLERVYCLVQLKHYLSKFNMCYEDLIYGNIKSYKEKTNGICYYVITAILFFNFQQTMNWFIEHNETLLQFTKENKHFYMFYHYLKSVYKDDKLLKTLFHMKDYKLNHLSMSVFDIDLFTHSSQSGKKEIAED